MGLIGSYSGELSAAYDTPDTLACLERLPAWLASAQVTSSGRNRNYRAALPVGGRVEPVMVKAFGPQSWIRDWRDRRRGSKAYRSWRAATHLSDRHAGTPAPVGYLERWEGGRLRESYFIAAYEENAQTLHDALLELYHERPECAPFMDLLEVVAAGIRAMHAAGFVHHDLGNHNVLLKPDGRGGWREFQVVDLNRGRLRGELSWRERGRDLSRLHLPSQLWVLLNYMYCGGVPPAALLRWGRWYRWLQAVRGRTRRWRRPLREARLRRNPAPARTYPAPRDIWIWDERSGQPIGALDRRERVRSYSVSRTLRTLIDPLRAAPRIWREHRALRERAFTSPVDFAGRIGMAVNPSPATLERELALLAGLGRVPAFVRFYHHEGRAQLAFRAELVQALHRAGHPVAIALVQDRRAVREPAAWRDFCGEVLDAVAPLVEEVEVGHNINRAKWGVWDFRDVRALYAPLAALGERFAGVRFTGPAAIDFEYPFAVCALRDWPSGVPLAALSHHLYVDRRGAPENYQGAFSGVDKLVLLRAIARSAPARADRVTVTEVNWPLLGTGVWSPIRAPYVSPDMHWNDGGVSEDDYADYMLRFLCLALASGMVERVYWWRLVARGFGLVDDREPNEWRPRPAYAMLRTFLDVLGGATFVGAQLPAPGARALGRYRFAFRRPDGENVLFTYANGPALPFSADESFGRAEDAFGAALEPRQLTGRPIYLRGA